MRRRRGYLAIVCIMMIVAAGSLPVAFDEAYYWTWSRSLGWTYLDHPPAIAWFIAASTYVFGDGRVALRILSLGSSAVIAIASVSSVFRLVPADRRRRAGWLVLLTLSGSLMFVVGYLPATPDPIQGAVLAMAAYFVVRALRDEPRAAIVAAFLLVGGIIVKHSSATVALGALVGAVSTADGRRLLTRPYVWLGGIAGGLLLLPWLFGDGGGSTAFQTARVFENATTRGILGVPLTIGAMLLMLGAPVTIGILGLVRVRDAVARTLAGGALGLVVACAVAAWLGTGEVNWVMPALVFALPAVVAWVVRFDRAARVYEAITWVTSAVWLVALVHIAVPILPIPPHKDRTLRPAGFESVALAAEASAKRYGARGIIARRYQVASMMRFHLRDRIDVYELGTSRKSQFDRWPRPSLCTGDLAVVVMPGSEIPMSAERLEPSTQVARVHRGRTIDQYVVTPVRLTADLAGCTRPKS